jgi:hypothetical protein
MAKSQRPGTLIKSIPLWGGRQDNVEEFHQDSPTMADVENGRFTKEGQVEKFRYLETKDTGAGLTLSPVALTTIDGKVCTVGTEGEVGVWDDDAETWAERDTRFLPSRNEVVTTVAPDVGAQKFSFADDGTYRLVVYERSVPNSNNGLIVLNQYRQVSVVAEVYSLATEQLLDRQVYTDYHTPECIYTGTALVLYMAQNNLGDTSANISYCPVSGSTLPGTPTPLGVTCDVGYPRDGEDYDDLRIGFCQDGGGPVQARYKVAGDRSDAEDGGIIVWKEDVGSNIESQTLWPSGSLYGSSTSVTGSGDQMILLDVDVYNNVVYLMYAWVRDVAGTWKSKVWVRTGENSGNPSFTTSCTVYDDVGTVPVGSCRYRTDTTAYYAFSYVPRDPTDQIPGALGNGRTEFGMANNGTRNEYCTIRDHRLVSNVVGSSSTCRGVIEQWNTIEPKTTTTGVAYVPLHLKAHTAVLVDTKAGDFYRLRSAFDVGQSQNAAVSAKEQSTHLSTLEFDGTDHYFINRVQLVAEDIMHQPQGNDTLNKATMVLHPGEFRGTLYKVASAAATRPLAAIPFGRSVIFNSSIPSHYDGVALQELSPLDQPEILDFRLLSTGTGFGTEATHYAYEVLTSMDANDTRTIRAVVGYQDRSGHVHRSAPSFPLFVDSNVDADGDADDLWRSVTVSRPLSMSSDRDYFVEIYIGQGSLDQQLAGRFPFNMDDPADGAYFTLADSTKLQNLDVVRFSPVVYTAGNVLAADPWPNFEDFVITSNRMFAIGAANKGIIYYSKLLEENIAPEFSASLIIPIGRTRDLTGIGAIDDKIIVFTDSEIFAIYGTGPDNTGDNGDFIVDRLQTSFGCEDPESIVQYEEGLAFYSRASKEFHLISRDLQVVDIGKGIEDASAAVNTSLAIPPFDGAILVPDSHEIRWAFASTNPAEFRPDPRTGTGIPDAPARCRIAQPASDHGLAYNYLYKRWSRWEPLTTSSPLVTVKDSRAITMDATGRLYWEIDDTGEWYSADNGNVMSVTTPWIHTNTLQSFGRIDEIAILGKYLSDWYGDGSTYIEAGDLQVELWYDYEEDGVTPDTYRFRANQGDLGKSLEGDRMQITVHPGQPKCQAIKIKISEIPTTGVEPSEPNYATGRGFALNSMDIIYTPKAGVGSKTLSQNRSK